MISNICKHVLIILLIVGCKNQETGIQPIVSDLTVSVYASAIVQPDEKYAAYTEVPGIIDEIFVSEGDTVARGQILARIQASREDHDLKVAELQKKLAEEKLKGPNNQIKLLESDLRKLEVQLETDSLNYERQKKLWSKDIGSKTELENKALKYKMSKENLDATKRKLALTRTELSNQYKQSHINYERSKDALKSYAIKAKENGRIYKLYKEAGEAISVQEVFAEIGDAQSFIIELQVDESDIAELQHGQSVLIELDAYPGQSFKAGISTIYPSKDLRSQSFKLEAVFQEQPDRLYAGLSGEANIIVKEKKDVLLIPLEYLGQGNYVRDKNDNILPVETGSRNMEYVEILSGIDKNSILLRP